MDIDTPNTIHLIIELQNGDELEHKQVPTSETLWSILQQFQQSKNQNICKKYNKDNRFELPQIIYNNYPFAATLKQLLSTKLSDIAKHKRSNTDILRLKLVFKAQAFSIHELDKQLINVRKELKRSAMGSDSKEDKENNSDNDIDIGNKTLSKEFAMDVDPIQAQTMDQIYQKMEILLYKLCKSFASKEEFMPCMKLFQKVVNNLIKYPLDKPNPQNKDPTKFRKLNLKNAKLQSALFKYAHVMDLLILIGFTKDNSNDYLTLPPNNENAVLFQALVIKIGNCEAPKAAVPVLDKQVKIYTLDALRKFKVTESKIIADINANKVVTDGSLMSQSRAAMQRTKKKHRPDKLMTKAKAEELYGVKQRVYDSTLIRIEFPSKHIIEARFHPLTPIYKLFEFVDECIEERVKRLKYQLLLPPHFVIKNKSRDESVTFKSMGGMIPACTVRCVLNAKNKSAAEYNGMYIKSDLIKKHLTNDITSLRAGKSSAQSSGEQKGNEGSKGNTNNAPKKQLTKQERIAKMKAERERKKLMAKLAKLNK